jgi:phage gp29-like protein
MSQRGIFINPTEFQKFNEAARKDALIGQVASRERAYNGFSLGQWYLPNPDPVLKAMGKDITVYRDLQADPTIQGCIKSRHSGILRLNWEIEKGKASSAATKEIQLLFEDYDLPRMLAEMLEASLMGYAPMEVMYEYVAGKILPVDVVGKPQEWFAFSQDNQLVLRSITNPAGDIIPERKFLLPRQRASYNNPYGFPDLSCCYWPSVFSKGGMKFWVQFVEKFGAAWAIGKNSPGADDSETEELLDALEKLVASGVGVIPDNASVEIKESAGKTGSSALYRDLRRDCKADINLVLLGHEGAASSTPGRLGNDQLASDVRDDIVDADRRIIEAAFNTLIRWIWDLNYTGDRPRFRMWPDEDIDLSQSEKDKNLSEAMERSKSKLTPAYWKKTYNLDDEDIADLEPKAVATGATFAETDAFPDQQAIDKFLSDISDERLQEQAEGVLKPILQLFNEGSDYDVTKKLIDQYPAMKTDDIVELVARAKFVAEIWGRLNGRDA